MLVNPLLLAVKGGHLNAVKLLLDHNADTNLCDMSINKTLITIGTPNEDIVRLLLEHGMDPNARSCCYPSTILDIYNDNDDMRALIVSYGGKKSYQLGINYGRCHKCMSDIWDDFDDCYSNQSTYSS